MDAGDAQDLPRETLDTMCLSLVSGVGPRIRQALLRHFATAAEVLDAAPSDLRAVPGVGAKLAHRISAARSEIDVDKEVTLCRESGVHILTDEHPEFPRVLREIPDPPAVLYLLGGLLPADAMAIAMVGTRHATAYGKRQAERLAASLSRAGLTVISGLARGIDAAAHRGALAAGGRTLAVLGSGVLNIYPSDHKPLADQVQDSGALLSEMPPRFEPLSGSFPQRNRLISGLALGVIVVEAAARSGALITAEHAMEQGREVFAVPGPIDSRVSGGCHRLIREGAKLVESADDVLEELGPLFTPTESEDGRALHHPAELQLNDIERQILDAVATQPTDIEQISQATQLPVHRVLATVSVLEMRRLVRRVSGRQVVRV